MSGDSRVLEPIEASLSSFFNELKVFLTVLMLIVSSVFFILSN